MKKTDEILKKIKTTVVLFLLLTNYIFAQTTSENELIKGTWISEDTPEWKWEFKADGKCYDYYEGKLEDTYTYSIFVETSSYQSREVVHSFLKLVNIKDPDDYYIYQIFSLDDEYLQVSWIHKAGNMLFKKQ